MTTLSSQNLTLMAQKNQLNNILYFLKTSSVSARMLDESPFESFYFLLNENNYKSMNSFQFCLHNYLIYSYVHVSKIQNVKVNHFEACGRYTREEHAQLITIHI